MGPQLGATFVPGGFDDYYMPEVVAPSPQRYVSLFKYVDVPTRRRHHTHELKWRSGPSWQRLRCGADCEELTADI